MEIGSKSREEDYIFVPARQQFEVQAAILATRHDG